jgi:hypothetical protein
MPKGGPTRPTPRSKENQQGGEDAGNLHGATAPRSRLMQRLKGEKRGVGEISRRRDAPTHGPLSDQGPYIREPQWTAL